MRININQTSDMATLPVDELEIIHRFGPHRSVPTALRLSTSVEPQKLVKTHCCFCGQQCGIQLKVRDNQVIGFEPWEEFPFNRGMLCPKGVKRYLQDSHPDRLQTALARDPNAEGGFSSIPYGQAIAKVASEIQRLQATYGNDSIAMLSGASLTTEKTYLMGKFARVCLKTPYIDYNGRLCMVSAGAGNKKAFGIDRTTSPWSDMIGTEVVWVAGSNVAECSPITTNYIWQAREMGAKVIVQDPRITPIARTCDLFLPVKPGRDAALFAGVLQIMIENDWLDHDFIRNHTNGFEQVAEYCSQWPVTKTAEVTGVPERSIRQAAEWWGRAKTSFLFHARGIEHHGSLFRISPKHWGGRMASRSTARAKFSTSCASPAAAASPITPVSLTRKWKSSLAYSGRAPRMTTRPASRCLIIPERRDCLSAGAITPWQKERGHFIFPTVKRDLTSPITTRRWMMSARSIPFISPAAAW